MNHEFKSSNQIKGVKVYFVDGADLSFENDKNENGNSIRNGRKKAEEYCLNNCISLNKIIEFDSRTERDRYLYLKNKVGINELEHHRKWQLIAPFTNANGDEVEGMTYESDFTYREFGKLIVEDVKGSTYFIDDDFKDTKKLVDRVLLRHNCYLKVVLKKGNEWIEWKWGDPIKSSVSNKKARNDLKLLKQTNHDKEVEENKKQREIARYRELRAKEHLTSSERKRFNELETILKEKGVII